MILAVLISCFSFATIQADYYSDNSLKVASLEPDDLCLSGDSLSIAYNRIARANYKHASYRRALRFAKLVHPREHEKLKQNTESLKALLYQNTGHLKKADSLYQVLLKKKLYRHTAFEVNLNYAELLRLNLDYKGRQRHLLLALSYAEGPERDKTIRVLARHYFNVLQDFEAAGKMILLHSRAGHTKENEAGLLLVKAEFAEAAHSYKKAMAYYKHANEVAKQAGFISFSADAADGYMRSDVLAQSEELDIIWRDIMIALLLSAGLGYLITRAGTKSYRI